MIFTYKDEEYVGVKKEEFERMFYTTLSSTNMVLVDESKSEKDVEVVQTKSKKDVETKVDKDIRVIRTESGKGLWVKGDTKSIKDVLIELGGKWNRTEQAWIFSLKKEDELLRVLKIKKEDIEEESFSESEEELFSKSNESEESFSESEEETNKVIRVGDYFELEDSGVTTSYYPARVTKVYTQNKVTVFVDYFNKTVVITKRRDNIWRKLGKKKTIGSGREIGNIYTYTGKDKPKTVVNEYFD